VEASIDDISNSHMRSHRRLLLYSALGLIAFAIRFGLSAERRIGFDEAWDIFVSRQDSLVEFFRSVAATSHPPGVYALLHLTSCFGSPQLIDPLLSVICGIVSIIFVGKIVRQLGCSFAAEAAAMILCTFSQSHVLVSVIVRPYALANALMLVSYFYWLRFLRSRLSSPRDSALFFLALVGAFFSHYSALLYGAALFLSFVIFMLFQRETRYDFYHELLSPLRFLKRQAIGIAALALFALYLMLSSQGGLFVTKSLLATKDPLQLTPYRYLRNYMYSAGEPLFGFLVRALQFEVNLFSPVQFGLIAANILCLFILLIFILSFARSLRVAKEEMTNRDAFARAFTALFVTFLPLVPLALALFGKYPFGGELRQQFFVFSFLLVALIQAVDRTFVRLPKFTLGVAAFCSIGAIAHFSLTPIDDEEFGKLPELAKLEAKLKPGGALYVGTWSAFTWYGQNREWKLHFENRNSEYATYSLRRGSEALTLYVDPQVYFANFLGDDLPQRIRNLMQKENLSELFVFGFPLGRIHNEIPGRKMLDDQLTAILGSDQFEVHVEREKARNGEGFAIVRRKG
jgi:hypothetical protein